MLKAKQLFDSQYALNRRRLFSTAIYYARLLQQQFENNYNNLESYLSKSYNKRKNSSKTVMKKQKSSILLLSKAMNVFNFPLGSEKQQGKRLEETDKKQNGNKLRKNERKQKKRVRQVKQH